MTIDDLYAKLDKDLFWRKTKISHLYSILLNDNNSVILESIILMLYSHWEGYIKNISKLYLDYIASKSIIHNKLLDNFSCIFIKGLIKSIYTASDSSSINNELRFYREFEELKKKEFCVKNKSIINTNSNLNYKVYKNILITLGIDFYKALESREKYIGEFLHTRNAISHGDKIHPANNELIDLSEKAVKELKNFIFEVMSRTQDTIKVYAEKEFYLIKNIENKKKYDSENNESMQKFLE